MKRAARPGIGAGLSAVLRRGLWAFAPFLVACGDPPKDGEGEPRDVTWYQNIQPLMQENCAGCHFSGSQLVGGAFDNYEATKAYGSAILAKLRGDTDAPFNMPPYPPIDEADDCQIPGPLRDDPRLSAEEVRMFARWVDEGALEGDAARAAPFNPQPPSALEGEDVLEFPGVHHTVPAARADRITGIVDYDHTQCFSIGIDPDEDVLLSGFAVVADDRNPGTVHHVIIGTDPYGDTYPASAHEDAYDGAFHPCESASPRQSVLMYTFTPGGFPLNLPPDSAYPLRAGARLTFTIHYHRGQTEVVDETSMRLRVTSEPPTYMAYMGRFGGASTTQQSWVYRHGGAHGGWDKHVGDTPFRLPANDPDYHMVWKEDNTLTRDYPIWAVFPHMHYAGSDIRISLDHTDGTETCLGHIAPFDFNWQITYQYDRPLDELPVFRGTEDGTRDGDTVKVNCHYDNTMANDRLRDALLANGFTEPFDMFVGEDGFDEMCVMHYGLIIPWPS